MRIAALTILLSGCYAPHLADCQYACGLDNACGAGETCSNGLCTTGVACNGGRQDGTPGSQDGSALDAPPGGWDGKRDVLLVDWKSSVSLCVPFRCQPETFEAVVTVFPAREHEFLLRTSLDTNQTNHYISLVDEMRK